MREGVCGQGSEPMPSRFAPISSYLLIDNIIQTTKASENKDVKSVYAFKGKGNTTRNRLILIMRSLHCTAYSYTF